ncbi:MAG TPA: FliA/WhiG family RNA polymerase sigma factor [Ktedonobacteraceae bacterium]|nr:FliA/WhiG family RNA polymerase sigma factor [Ktedonobacteraceae bacterium]
MSAFATNEDVWAEFVTTRHPAFRDELILIYMPLVRFVVSRLGIPSVGVLDQEDLVSFGVIGLINAIDRFEPARGIRFEAFATPRIRGAVIDQLRAINWFPRSAIKRIRQVEGALAELEQRLGRSPTEVEVATEMDVSVERYRHMMQEANTTIFSLDAPLSSLSVEDDTVSVAELLEDAQTPGPAEQLEYDEMLAALNRAADQLPPREKQLLTLYYQKEMTMKEISNILHVSESRVCQLHMQAIARLRTTMDALAVTSVSRQPKQLQKERNRYQHARIAAKSR